MKMPPKKYMFLILLDFFICRLAPAQALPPLESQAHPGIFVVASLGDSISTGMDSTNLGDNKSVSFSTGWDPSVGSHASRLQQLMPHLQVRSINVAKAGAKSDDLARQAAEAARYVPDYATMLAGANDACSLVSNRAYDVQLFVNNVAGAISTLIRANPAIKIRLIPIPNMRRLYELGASKAHCRIKWSLAPVCRPMFSPIRGPRAKEEFFRLVDAYNASLNHIAQMFPANTTVSWGAAWHQFQPEDVSQLDCFHPSQAGQRTLAWLSFGGN
jgi:lysophospholipase L1-like esterase